MKTLQIAVPIPLRQIFDYLPPKGLDISSLAPGGRVLVPFQKRQLTGIFLGFTDIPSLSLDKLKPILEVLDFSPVIPSDILQLCQWAADYYHFPLGEVLFNALPSLIRKGKPIEYRKESYYRLTKLGLDCDFTTLKRAVKLAELLKILQPHSEGLSKKQLQEYGIYKRILEKALEQNYIEISYSDKSITIKEIEKQKKLTLNQGQQDALEKILESLSIFQVFLLDGVTGSGKTEVYLQTITHILTQKKQVLVLVPEIGLTPQTIQRFRERFAVPIVALHSGLSEKERLNAWLAAKNGDARIVIGTRSAVFTPFADLGLIVVDEEHDLSFKQQEGFRYHARDVAIMRAHFKKIPIILGSATPSLETLQQAERKRYQHLYLLERAGQAKLPQFTILDIRKITLEQGLSPALIKEIQKHVSMNNQVMLFLNRRGYAPVLLCHGCGWIALCKRCDARMTYHHSPAFLHCHHCDSRRKLPTECEACHENQLTTLGLGTERLEAILQKYFPNHAIARMDRDNTQRKGKMEELLEEIHQGKYHILIGTQMLAKGHHFPNVTLVAIVDMDSGFFSSDFRALERMGQLILQVSGRAGRVEKAGTVLIQTHQPENPLLHQLIHHHYRAFAQILLKEREQALLPPFCFFALFRAEAHHPEHANLFLQEIKNRFLAANQQIQLLGPTSAPMPKRAGRYRAQLLLQSNQRPILQQFLKTFLPEIEKIPSKNKVRWSLDIDPLEMF